MNDFPNRILRIFSNIGMAQIVPVLLSLFIIFLTMGAFFVFAVYAPMDQGILDTELVFFISLYIIASVLCLSGLLAFLFSSFRFIQANHKKNYDYITKGMYGLNWASFVLTLFTLVSSLIVAVGLMLYH